MAGATSRVAVVGGGIAGAVCASSLARNGVSVTLFESARGPGGRMSQRRETTEDGKELQFDHGAPYFNVTDPHVSSIVHEWESHGLVAEWLDNLGIFDRSSNKFVHSSKEIPGRKFVGIPSMNSICRALCSEPGVETKFGVGISKMKWSEDDSSWSLIGLEGQFLGNFGGVVASDKNIASPRIRDITGKPPPLDLNWTPRMAQRMQEIPVKPCFALMLAFTESLAVVPFRAFSIINSEVLSAAFCDSSKPGRSNSFECWVVHSTPEYAQSIITQYGLRKPSSETLTRVADELLQHFQSTGLCTSQPFFKKAHRWGSAFPMVSVAAEEKCLWDEKRSVAICGDFCTSPNVEGAILSGVAAASKIMETRSSRM